MKWNTEKMSPIIDGVITVLVIAVIIWLLPSDWFADAKAVEYQNFILWMMIIYHVGLWSGRRHEQKNRDRL